MLNPYVKAAGPYRVNQVPCPHFQMMVDLQAPRAVVMHTTEGSSIEGAESVFHHHFAPHFTLGKDAHGAVRIDQHVPIGFIGAALEAHNDLAIVQIEVVGFSKEQLWFFDDATADALAHLMVVLESDYGVPLTRPWKTGDWGRAGYQNPHRSSKMFGAVAGYFDHGDIPNNCHWDCGNLDWDKLFARANAIKGGKPATPPAGAPLVLDGETVSPKQMAVAKQIASFFTGKKLPTGEIFNAMHAAGFVANAWGETRLQPFLWGDNRVAYGLWQLHTNGVNDRLDRACKALGFPTPRPPVGSHTQTNDLTLDQYLEVAWKDLSEPELGHARSIAATTTANDAGVAICALWERAGAHGAAERRGKWAEQWLEALK